MNRIEVNLCNNDDVLFHQRLQTIIVNPMLACAWIKEFQFPA